MSTLFQTDKQRVQLYLAENAGWMKILITQKDEIPGLKKMLRGEKTAENDDKINIEKDLFTKEWTMQQEEMILLNTALDQQQQRLKTDTAKNYLYDIDSLCSQDILRDRIKEIEKKYIELKCSFMKFLATII
jgi:acyl carrier protein phosphodiesterase